MPASYEVAISCPSTILVFTRPDRQAIVARVDLRELFLQTDSDVLTWKQLRMHVTERALVRAIGTGAIVRDGRGVYRLAATPPECAVAAQLRGVLSHLSAAQHWRSPSSTPRTRVQLEQEIDRYNEFAAAGYRLLRFTWNHVMHRRAWLVEAVRRAYAPAISG